MCVFGPVWVDRYAPEHAKSLQLTFLMLATPLGVVFGYGLSYAMIKYENWRWAYYIQLVLAVPEAIAFLLFPSSYLDIQKAIKDQESCLNNVRGHGETSIDDGAIFSTVDANERTER